MMNDLKSLLIQVDKLFGNTPDKIGKPRLASHDYSLNRFPYGWSFGVTNSWHKWSNKGLKYDFGVWASPEMAVREFLEYVKKNKINVKRLMDKT